MLFRHVLRRLVVGVDGASFVHGDIGEVAAGDPPLVAGFDDHRGGQPQERCRVRKDLNDVGAALDLPVEPLDYPALEAVTCRVLGFSTRAFYKWRKTPLSQRDWDDAHLINAARGIHADDPAFGY